MIQHLNPVDFQSFGAILPERARESGADALDTLDLTSDNHKIYQSHIPVGIRPGECTAILSVSTDGQTFSDFYLDKPICVNAGVFFSFHALHPESAVLVTGAKNLKVTGINTHSGDFSVSGNLQVNKLYTCFYHEKEKGFLFPGEAHHMLELTYVDQGTLHSVADGKDLILQQGDFTLYAPDQWHMQYADMDVSPRYVTLSFTVSGGDLTPLFNRVHKTGQKTMAILQQLLQEYNRQDEFSLDMMLTLLTQLLIILLRQADSGNSKLPTAYSLHNENEIVRKAQQFISKNIRKKLSVPIVSSGIDISPSYLTALFHKHLQISPAEYIRRTKLQESKQMIRENTMNFTEIAAVLQYSTVHHFSRQFKEHFGITPSEYAKSVR